MFIDFSNKQDNVDNLKMTQMLVSDFLASPERKLMQEGEKYYLAENSTISDRKMYRYKKDPAADEPKRIEDKSKPNNKRIHAFMHLLVEDKINYLLSKPYTLSCEKSEELLDRVQQLLGESFQEKRISRLGVKASNNGIAWLHPYIDEKGQFKTIIVPGDQGIPGWMDDVHEELYDFVWFYNVNIIEDYKTKQLTKAEYWTAEGVAYYVSRTAVLPGEEPNLDFILDAEKYLDVPEREDEFTGHFTVADSDSSWGRVPFIAFKNNDYEMPDLKFIQSLVDGYDKKRSDVANYLDEIENVVYKLRGYGGNDLGEFMRDLNYFRAISLDEDGDADSISSNIDISAAKEDYDQLRKDIFTFGQGVDKDSDKLGNSPSGIALKFMYSGLDLKCNKLESAFKKGFSQLIWFVNRYFELTHQGADYEAKVKITFNRDININESQAIVDCAASKGIISDRTIIANHPWTQDVDEEIKLLEEQNKLPEDIGNMFPPKGAE